MSSVSRVTLEVRTSRESLQTPEAAVQFLASLPNPPHGVLQSWKPGLPFVLEFLNQGQTIYELLTIPEGLTEYVSSQLTASYPEILIKKLEHNPLQEFELELPKSSGEVFFSSSSQFPIKTFRETGDGDPMSTMLSSLAKLAEGEAGLMQLYIRKSRERWKNNVRSSSKSSTEGAQTVQLPSSHQAAVSRKLALASYEVSFRFLAQAATKERADQIVDGLATSLTALQSETNSLVMKRPLLGKKRLVRDILNRTHTTLIPNMANWQYFSVDELATVWHMPNKQLSTIKNIAWGKNLLGEPPENLPTSPHTPDEERVNLNLFGRTEFKNQEQIFGIRRLIDVATCT